MGEKGGGEELGGIKGRGETVVGMYYMKKNLLYFLSFLYSFYISTTVPPTLSTLFILSSRSVKPL